MRRAIVALISSLVLFCLMLEVTTRAFYGRISRIRGRIEAEHTAALASGVKGQRPDVLIAGNSLLLLGVDYPELQRSLAPQIKIDRFVVESTGYLDWYYGLRQILQRGGRPDAVVLVLSPRQFLAPGVAGDLFANVMLDRGDLLRLIHDTHADRTTATNLLLDTLSDFYGSRAEIRNWLLNKAMPRSAQLADFLRPHALPVKEDDSAVELAAARLAQIRTLTQHYGARFVLVVPPQLSTEGIGTLQQAAAQADATFLVPLGPGVLPSSEFSDGQHLTAHGAAVFTPALAHEIMKLDLRANSTLTSRTDFPR